MNPSPFCDDHSIFTVHASVETTHNFYVRTFQAVYFYIFTSEYFFEH